MVNDGPTEHVTVDDLPPVKRSAYKRLRGYVVSVGRRTLGTPTRRHFPLDAFRAYHRLRSRIAPERYIDGDPFEVFEVDPNRIEHSVLSRSPRRPQWGRIVDGAWDRDIERFGDRPVVKAIKQRFEDGRDWDETALVDAFELELRTFGNAWDYRSMEQLKARAREIERLYERIESEGYRTQTSLGYTPLDEINVDIARDGTPMWRCYGQHRLAIAQVLNLETVPVIVPRRHPEGIGREPWQ